MCPCHHLGCAEPPMTSATSPQLALAGVLAPTAQECIERKSPRFLMALTNFLCRGSSQSTAPLGQATTGFSKRLPLTAHSARCKVPVVGLNFQRNTTSRLSGTSPDPRACRSASIFRPVSFPVRWTHPLTHLLQFLAALVQTTLGSAGCTVFPLGFSGQG
jgi:hypothetical protein